MDVVTAWVTGVATLLAALAAIASWRSSVNANLSAQRLAQIEIDRHHAELAPRFKLRTRFTSDGAIYLHVKLVGPAALSGLNSLRIRVRDDAQEPPRPYTGDWSEEQISAVVWGPYRFRPGVDGADENGRTVRPIKLDLGNGRDFVMDPTPPPPWVKEPENRFWIDRNFRAPIKLTMECGAEGQTPWSVPLEVKSPERPVVA